MIPAQTEPLVSIVIPAFNKWDFTFRCLMSIARHTGEVHHEVIVVDNASADDTRLALPRLEGLRWHRNEENLGFARACNQGAAMARGRHVLFLNNDTEALAGWLSPMVRLAESDRTVGVVGAKLLFPDGTLQHAGVAIAFASPFPITPVHIDYRRPASASTRPLELSCVTGACLLIDRALFHDVGGFDESYRNGYEDVDLCFKVRARGRRIAYTPESVLYHHEGVSGGRHDRDDANLDLLHRRWLGKFTGFDCRPEPRARTPRPGASLSAVVPVHNSLSLIAGCLESLELQLGDGEILVAHAGSTDATLVYAEHFAATHPGRVRIVAASPEAGLPGAIRIALEAAQGPLAMVLPGPANPVPGAVGSLCARLGASEKFTASLDPQTGYWFAGDLAELIAIARTVPAALVARTSADLQRALDGAEVPLHGAPPGRQHGGSPRS